MLAAFTIISILAAITATILAFIFIVPESKRAKLNQFGKLLHDICNFKFLVIEKVLQCFYILATTFIIVFGFFNIFNFVSYGRRTIWYGYYGILMMILGPIVIRISYEIMLLGILKLKNVIQINNKLKNQNNEEIRDAFSGPNFKEYIPEKNNTPNPNYPNYNNNYYNNQNFNPNYNNPQYYNNAPAYPQNPAPAPAPTQNNFCVKCGSVLQADGTCPNCH